MTVLGILQNQWFEDPVRAQRIYDQYEGNYDTIAKLNSRYLFYQSKTGKRLKGAFGERACHDIVWWEASRQKAGKSSVAFAPEPEWIVTAIRHFKPGLVITFGGLAKLGTNAAVEMILSPEEVEGFDVLYAPHPAARYAQVEWELMEVAGRARERYGLAV